jgi:Flp pilus assembly protein TadB
MSRSRADSRRRTAFPDPSWQSIATSYVLVLAAFGLLVALSYPLASVIVAAVVGVTLVVGPKVVWLVRCARNCRTLTVDLAGVLRVTFRGTGDAQSRERPSRS